MSAARSDPVPASGAELCSESEVADLAQAFYARMRDDPVLGPTFARHVADEDTHTCRR
jgi:hemoglobin